jgi:hypothetical protein
VKRLLDEPERKVAIHTLVHPTVIYQDGQQVHVMTSVIIERGRKGCVLIISTGPIDFINGELADAREAWGKSESRTNPPSWRAGTPGQESISQDKKSVPTKKGERAGAQTDD